MMANRYLCSLIERFEEKYIPEPNTGCWIWLSAVDHRGYGRFSKDNKNYRAPRISWMLYRGEPYAGSHILHKCDNRLCVNPDHLFLGSNKDNSMDKAIKGRVPHAKLNPDAVRDIRERRSSGATISSLAKRYGVVDASIASIFRGKSWQHVQ